MCKLIELLANKHLKKYYDEEFSNIFVRKFKILWENLKFCGKIQLIELLENEPLKKYYEEDLNLKFCGKI